jgi:hypothetical protein
MAMMVVLLESEEGDVPLRSRTVGRVARLGVTNVAVFCDDRTNCIVLEGWAFNPAGSASDIVSAIAAASHTTRAVARLHMVAGARAADYDFAQRRQP